MSASGFCRCNELSRLSRDSRLQPFSNASTDRQIVADDLDVVDANAAARLALNSMMASTKSVSLHLLDEDKLHRRSLISSPLYMLPASKLTLFFWLLPVTDWGTGIARLDNDSCCCAQARSVEIVEPFEINYMQQDYTFCQQKRFPSEILGRSSLKNSFFLRVCVVVFTVSTDDDGRIIHLLTIGLRLHYRPTAYEEDFKLGNYVTFVSFIPAAMHLEMWLHMQVKVLARTSTKPELFTDSESFLILYVSRHVSRAK